MILVIDAGNSFVKAAVFEHVNLVEKFRFDYTNPQLYFSTIFSKYAKIDTIVSASVAKIENFESFLPQNLHYFKIDRTLSYPYVSLYETSETLGIDRMVLIAGATILFPNKHKLIIGTGTCITYNFINEKNQFLGGIISPGIKMRLRAMHEFTANLPLIEKAVPKNLLGKNTNDSINNGAVIGTVYEIEGIISEYKVKNPDFMIILTGGDTNFLADNLKSSIFADENFLLKSLLHLYYYNKKK